MSVEAPPTTPPSPPKDERPRPRIAIGVVVLLAVIAAYALSLFGVLLFLGGSLLLLRLAALQGIFEVGLGQLNLA